MKKFLVRFKQFLELIRYCIKLCELVERLWKLLGL